MYCDETIELMEPMLPAATRAFAERLCQENRRPDIYLDSTGQLIEGRA
jgi:hypothetical protein